MNNRIAEIRARCDKATPGPWKSGLYQSVMATYTKICNTERDADADFIANSRSDIPYLLTEIELLQSALEGARRVYAEDGEKLATMTSRAEAAENEVERLKSTNKALESDNYNAELNLSVLTAEVERLTEAQRWIPVTERLPEVGECVLLRQTYHALLGEHGEYEGITIGYLHQPADGRRNPYFYWVAVSDYGDMVRANSICPGSKYITHWRELPEPPAEKG